jgi:predicted ATPase
MDYEIKKISEIIEKYSGNEQRFLIGEIIDNIEPSQNQTKNEITESITKEFGEGYSRTNLNDFVKFYREFKDFEKKEELFELTFNEIKSILSGKKNIIDIISDKKSNSYNCFVEIDNIYINNYKSLSNLKLYKPPRFLIFAGSNSSGKSNLFEALDFLTYSKIIDDNRLFYNFDETGISNIFNKKEHNKNSVLSIKITFNYQEIKDFTQIEYEYKENDENFKPLTKINSQSKLINNQFFNYFSRIFLGSLKTINSKITDNSKLKSNGENLSNILEKILIDDEQKEIFISKLKYLIPEFKNIEINASNLNGKKELIITENSEIAISQKLISDGSFKIIALLTAIYQTQTSQFLCIEEIENGLNPKVLRDLIETFKELCEENGYYIWLTTHSPELFSFLPKENIAIVDKIGGETKIKLLRDIDLKNISPKEAWLNNVVGGLPW